MPQLELKNYRTGEIIFTGPFRTVKDCVESAIEERVTLDFVDLRHADLSHGNFDGAVMRHARMTYTNLAGANFSEAYLDHSCFRFSTLHGTCLACSSLKNCNFDGAFFGATDITHSRLSHGRFSTSSAFTLPFLEAQEMRNCLYRAPCGTPCAFSSPPHHIHGMDYEITALDRHLKIGLDVRPYNKWQNVINDNGHTQAFYNAHKHWLEPLIKARSASRTCRAHATDGSTDDDNHATLC